jgi:methionyl-tRNA formyltransferase
MRILFMGTPEFAVPCVDQIIKDGHTLCAVFTQPDRPRGRGLAMRKPPVKEAAEKYGVPVYQPEKLRDGTAAQIIRDLAPDAIVVTAYGRILPEEILNIPPLGCINVHGSLLPAYRGAAPMQWAIINGEKVTGITTQYMAKGIDTGDIILKEALPIGGNETFGELHDAMMALGAQMLSKTLVLLAKGEAPRTPQSEEGATYAPLIDNAVKAIDFRKSAAQVHNLVRGLAPTPGATAVLGGIPVKIYGTVLPDEPATGEPGTIVQTDAGIRVCCGDKQSIIITLMQAQGGKKMAASDYLRGHKSAASGRFSC